MSDYDQRVARAIVNGEMTTLEADRDAWKARAEKAEADLAKASAIADELVTVQDARVDQADAETDEWVSRWKHANARAIHAEGQVEKMTRVAEEHLERAKAAETNYQRLLNVTADQRRAAMELVDRATQAEAQAAAMREALVVVFASVNTEDEDYPAALESYCHAFDGSAGRTLLAELEALRALDAMLRGTWTAEERVAALAAVDAALKGGG